MTCAAANYTLFVYMEDDLELTWAALQAWALDESLLAPLGYHRGFVRTEVAQWDGSIMAPDQVKHTSLSRKPSPVLSIAAPTATGLTHPSKNAADFVHIHSTYMAMWLGSRNQLAACFKRQDGMAAELGMAMCHRWFVSWLHGVCMGPQRASFLMSLQTMTQATGIACLCRMILAPVQ